MKLVPQGDFLAATTSADTGAAQYGKPNQNKITHTYRDGHKDTNARGYCYRYDEGYQPLTGTWEQPAHPGDVLSIWRYLKTSETLYWPAWSTDEITWHALTKTTLYNIHGAAYPDYYISDITIPETAEDGSEFTVYLKMIDKATYEALDVVDEAEIVKLRNAAIAVVEAAFNACNQSEYAAAGIKALTDALHSETAVKYINDTYQGAVVPYDGE